jgi:hypothetical protein
VGGKSDRTDGGRAVSATSGVPGVIGSVVMLAFATVWILIFGGGVVLMWIDPQGLRAADPIPLSEMIGFTGVFLAGLGLMRWMGIPFRQVVMTAEGLRIAGLGRSELVAYADVADVDQFTWAHPRMVTIRFSRPTPFGRTIRFRPRAWFAIPVIDGEDWDVVEIRDRSMRARPPERSTH